MPAYIQHISTRVPENYYDQQYVREFMKRQFPGHRLTSMIMHRIYTQSGIEKRHSVLREFHGEPDGDGAGAAPAAVEGNTGTVPGNAQSSGASGQHPATPTGQTTARGDRNFDTTTVAGGVSAPPDEQLVGDDEPLFRIQPDGTMRVPTTGERNALYTREARKLFIATARGIFEERPDLQPASVTHVITVSCTGFYAPGPDLDIVNALGLSPATQRLHIGFMGCYAALPALRMADSITGNDPSAVVLIVAAELCTLHLKFESDTDSLLSTTVFADGCAAALVTGSDTPPLQGALQVDQLHALVTPNGAEDMAWTIGDHGFDMVLSSYIPDIIEGNLDSVLAPVWKGYGLTPEDISIWAVHPGGRAIVDKVQDALGLNETQVASSRKILRDYGNMSSATVLFVLRDVMDRLRESDAGEQRVLAMAFGPGLTVETGLMTYLP